MHTLMYHFELKVSKLVGVLCVCCCLSPCKAEDELAFDESDMDADIHGDSECDDKSDLSRSDRSDGVVSLDTGHPPRSDHGVVVPTLGVAGVAAASHPGIIMPPSRCRQGLHSWCPFCRTEQ